MKLQAWTLRKLKCRGQAMLVAVVLMAAMIITIHHRTQFIGLGQQHRFLQTAEIAQSLLAHRQSLIEYATMQGYNSLTQFGRLPCPSSTENGLGGVTCLNQPIGFLPLQTASKTNYLNLSPSTQSAPYERQMRMAWMYGVSPQVIQPNPLGWGQWVDFNKPAIQVEQSPGSNIEAVAVIAREITSLGPNQVSVSHPSTVLAVEDFKNILNTHAHAFAIQQYQRWMNVWHLLKLTPPSPDSIEYPKDQLTPNSDGHKYLPIASNASCVCSKTRCTCSADTDESWWISLSPCVAFSEYCNTVDEWKNNDNGLAETTGEIGAISYFNIRSISHYTAPIYLCRSSSGTVCQFKGPVAPASRWPTTEYNPIASKHTGCAPTDNSFCPLAKSSTSCACTYSWPDSIINRLTGLAISTQP